jgi:hypothetical protein
VLTTDPAQVEPRFSTAAASSLCLLTRWFIRLVAFLPFIHIVQLEALHLDVNQGGRGGRIPPEFAVGDAYTGCPAQIFVAFQNFKRSPWIRPHPRFQPRFTALYPPTVHIQSNPKLHFLACAPH